MKLEIARGLFGVAALSVAVFAGASWYEPGHGVVNGYGRSYCPSPELKRSTPQQGEVNQNLFLLVMSLSQGLR